MEKLTAVLSSPAAAQGCWRQQPGAAVRVAGARRRRPGSIDRIDQKKTGVFASHSFTAVLMLPQGKLLASVNNRVQLYGWVARDGGAQELAPECGHSGHTCALYVETRGDSVLVGAPMQMEEF